MKCENCGKNNPENHLYCCNCGELLRKRIACSRCGKELPKDSKFCIYCGGKATALRGADGVRSRTPIDRVKTRQRFKAAKGRNTAGKIRWLQIAISAFVGVTAAVVVVFIISLPSSPSQNPSTGPRVNVTWAEGVQQIAANFNCPCEKCGVIRLDLCTCDIARGAVEVKSYIQNLLNQKLETEEIVRKVEQRYGYKI